MTEDLDRGSAGATPFHKAGRNDFMIVPLRTAG